MQLPTVEGSNLLRQKMIFPRDFAGEINLVFIAFQRWHQDVIDRWVPFVQRLARENEHLHYYEFPTLPDSNFLYRLFLNEGMRAGIPSEDTRGRTITLYLDKQKFRQALQIPNEKNVWIVLFDQAGRVLWRTKGDFSEEKGHALIDAINANR